MFAIRFEPRERCARDFRTATTFETSSRLSSPRALADLRRRHRDRHAPTISPALPFNLSSFLPPAHTHHVPHLTSDRWFTREDLLLAKFYERLWPATETRRVSSLLFLSKNEKIIFYEEQGLYTLIGELLGRRKIVGRGLSKNMCESRRWLRTVGWSMFERLYYYSSLINAVATCSSPRLPNRRHGFHAVNRSGSINHNQWRLEGVTARSVASRLKRFWNGEEM